MIREEVTQPCSIGITFKFKFEFPVEVGRVTSSDVMLL